jgi:hypothetical protein
LMLKGLKPTSLGVLTCKLQSLRIKPVIN